MKSGAEIHRTLTEVHGTYDRSEIICREWLRIFKTYDFNVKDKYRSANFKNVCKDSTKTEKLLATYIEYLSIKHI